MEIEVINDAKVYINRVICNNNSISWSYEEDKKIDYFLIIKSPFGEEFNINDNVILSALSRIEDFSNGQTYDINEKRISILFFKNQRLLGYKYSKKPARYSVFACNYENNTLKIFANNYKSEYYDIYDTLSFNFKKVEKVKKGFFSKILSRILSRNEDDREYVRISLENEVPMEYKDGDLSYGFDKFKYDYPITRKMLKNGFIVPLYNNQIPIIKSISTGFNGEIEGK